MDGRVWCGRMWYWRVIVLGYTIDKSTKKVEEKGVLLYCDRGCGR